jgi:hypothetical protein
MINETEKLIQKITYLQEVLKKTNNTTVSFYDIVINKIRNCISEDELKKVLDGRLIHAAGITDYGGYNREQCDLFSEMWKVAKAICEKKTS